jgi:hypothetical protein
MHNLKLGSLVSRASPTRVLSLNFKHYVTVWHIGIWNSLNHRETVQSELLIKIYTTSQPIIYLTFEVMSNIFNDMKYFNFFLKHNFHNEAKLSILEMQWIQGNTVLCDLC